MRILVTGGAGFIGTALCKELANRDHEVTIIDNISPQVHTSFNYEQFTDLGIDIYDDDIRDRDLIDVLVESTDVVIHLASETGTGQSMYEFSHYFDVNVMGTSYLLEAIKRHPVKKLIVASSRAIYGEGRNSCPVHGPVEPVGRNNSDLSTGVFEPRCPFCGSRCFPIATSELNKCTPRSMYAITKNTQEQMIMLFGEMNNIPTVALRLQNVYGPNQSLSNPYTGILSIFSSRFKQNKDVIIFEDGNEARDFVYIDDVVNAFILSLESDKANGHVFNVGSGKMISVLEIANKLKALYKSKSEIKVTGNYRLGDIRSIYADFSKIKTILSYEPSVTIDEGLHKFINWVNCQDIPVDKYEKSMDEMINNGIIK